MYSYKLEKLLPKIEMFAITFFLEVYCFMVLYSILYYNITIYTAVIECV